MGLSQSIKINWLSWTFLFTIGGAVGFLGGCATLSTETNPSQNELASQEASSPAGSTSRPPLPHPVTIEEILPEKPKPRVEIKEEIAKTEKPNDVQSPFGELPLEVNDHVKKWIRYFTQKDRERFQKFLNQGHQYREVVENLLEQNQLPPELYYLAMIESGYSTRATSLAKAAGVWQFIPATGKRYGLEVNHYTDERRDPIRATEAATKYLRDLYNVFGSWYLAMAAYNAGEFRVMTSVIRGKSRDFWTLVKNGVLPAETADYIPKFLAAVEIGENPEAYGFTEPQSEKYPNLHAIEVPSPARLGDVAQVLKLPLEELKRLNPNLRGSITPPKNHHYDVWVPEEYVKNFDAEKIKLAPFKLSTRTYKESRVVRYRVKRGDRLSQIAQRYNVSVKSIRVSNGLRRRPIYVGQVLKIKTHGG